MHGHGGLFQCRDRECPGSVGLGEVMDRLDGLDARVGGCLRLGGIGRGSGGRANDRGVGEIGASLQYRSIVYEAVALSAPPISFAKRCWCFFARSAIVYLSIHVVEEAPCEMN